MQNDEVWMRFALQEARLAAAEGEIPVGAVLVRDGQEICRAHNLRENQHDPTAHAEILCMRRGAEKLGTWRRGGCSPIGMKKHFPTYIHETCTAFPYIYISAGIRGLQIKIAADDLIKETKAEICSLFTE